MTDHQLYLNRCCDLAYLDGGNAAPNPRVGAVLVHQDRIIGEGYHARFGGPHAEVNALQAVLPADRSLIPDSTLYVSLEPCNFAGKTPACSDLILREKIPQVVIGALDPNPRVAGKSMQSLIDKGVAVHLEAHEGCTRLIRPFKVFQRCKRPYVVLKWAQSLDGFIGKTDQSVWLTGNASRRISHLWRQECAAILVGTKTAVVDNPSLNIRFGITGDIIRMAIDLNERIPKTHNLFDGRQRTVIFTSTNTYRDVNIEGLQLIRVEDASHIVERVLKTAFDLNIQSLIVEGGTKTIASFIGVGYWDEARVIRTQKVLKDGISAPRLQGETLDQETCEVGEDVIEIKLNVDEKRLLID